ncbi:MAG: calcium/sodium antiporter [Bacilli bacterium]|nr:calcium/sodium antiporter [Bacilli bacterium]
MLINLILLIIGFVVLIKGADFFVEGASGIATNCKVSKVLIGLTIVAFGTSAPEFAVSIKSLITESGDIVLGNVIGSNIINILLIIGSSALFHSLTVKNHTVKREIPIMLMMTCAFAVLLSDHLLDATIPNIFTRGDGMILVLFFSIFLYYLVKMTQKKEESIKPEMIPIKQAVVYTIVGLIGIILGGNVVVDSAVIMAQKMGVTERMISLTIIALGTSLPELVTSIEATYKGEVDIAIGNVVGSNIFNIGMVMGIPVTILGSIRVIGFHWIDLLVMIIATILLLIFSLNDYKISKKEGITFLLLLIMYYSYVVLV